MREILFRAKAINRDPKQKYRTKYKNGDWVYGLVEKLPLIKNGEKLYDTDYAEMRNTCGVSGIDVDENTICEFTGLNDKNDKPIYEGDIITCVNKSRHSGYPIGKKMYGFIAYDDNYGFWFCKNNFQHYIDWSWADDIEVIGNIYDNPEVLRGAK